MQAGLDESALEAVVDSVVADYRLFSSLWGYLIATNPSYRDFYRLGRIQARLAQNDPQHPAWCLIPGPDTRTADLEMPSFAAYLTNFLEIVRPTVLACALVPGLDYTLSQNFFTHLDFINKVRTLYDILFWGMFH